VSDAKAGIRCADSARRELLDPAGTAGSYDGVVLAEWPLPWPRDVGTIPALAELHRKAQSEYGGRWRLQAIAPPARKTGDNGKTAQAGAWAHRTNAAGASADDPVTPYRGDVLLYRRPRQAFAGFEPIGPDTGRVVLVCTHGSRDRCCGSLGAALFHRLPAIPGVRIRRTSHTGGHRFAPTAMVLPEGTSWAYLDEETLAAIIARTAPVEQAARHYRGCFGLDGPELQAADRQALVKYGWGWLDTPRSGAVVGRDGGRVNVRIEAPGISHEVELELLHSAPVVQSCGPPPAINTKVEPQWNVVSFE
jgi:hypothetical protein